MIVRGESTIIDYHAPFDQGLSFGPLDSLLFLLHRVKKGHLDMILGVVS